jgi:hypothetical protein
MRQLVFWFLIGVAVALLIGALTGCGPQDDGKTCGGTGHVKICTRNTP